MNAFNIFLLLMLIGLSLSGAVPQTESESESLTFTQSESESKSSTESLTPTQTFSESETRSAPAPTQSSAETESDAPETQSQVPNTQSSAETESDAPETQSQVPYTQSSAETESDAPETQSQAPNTQSSAETESEAPETQSNSQSQSRTRTQSQSSKPGQTNSESESESIGRQSRSQSRSLSKSAAKPDQCAFFDIYSKISLESTCLFRLSAWSTLSVADAENSVWTWICLDCDDLEVTIPSSYVKTSQTNSSDLPVLGWKPVEGETDSFSEVDLMAFLRDNYVESYNSQLAFHFRVIFNQNDCDKSLDFVIRKPIADFNQFDSNNTSPIGISSCIAYLELASPQFVSVYRSAFSSCGIAQSVTNFEITSVVYRVDGQVISFQDVNLPVTETTQVHNFQPSRAGIWEFTLRNADFVFATLETYQNKPPVFQNDGFTPEVFQFAGSFTYNFQASDDDDDSIILLAFQVGYRPLVATNTFPTFIDLNGQTSPFVYSSVMIPNGNDPIRSDSGAFAETVRATITDSCGSSATKDYSVVIESSANDRDAALSLASSLLDANKDVEGISENYNSNRTDTPDGAEFVASDVCNYRSDEGRRVYLDLALLNQINSFPGFFSSNFIEAMIMLILTNGVCEGSVSDRKQSEANCASVSKILRQVPHDGFSGKNNLKQAAASMCSRFASRGLRRQNDEEFDSLFTQIAGGNTSYSTPDMVDVITLWHDLYAGMDILDASNSFPISTFSNREIVSAFNKWEAPGYTGNCFSSLTTANQVHISTETQSAAFTTTQGSGALSLNLNNNTLVVSLSSPQQFDPAASGCLQFVVHQGTPSSYDTSVQTTQQGFPAYQAELLQNYFYAAYMFVPAAPAETEPLEFFSGADGSITFTFKFGSETLLPIESFQETGTYICARRENAQSPFDFVDNKCKVVDFQQGLNVPQFLTCECQGGDGQFGLFKLIRIVEPDNVNNVLVQIVMPTVLVLGFIGSSVFLTNSYITKKRNAYDAATYGQRWAIEDNSHISDINQIPA